MDPTLSSNKRDIEKKSTYLRSLNKLIRGNIAEQQETMTYDLEITRIEKKNESSCYQSRI
jgi:hypothetical protein